MKKIILLDEEIKDFNEMIKAARTLINLIDKLDQEKKLEFTNLEMQHKLSKQIIYMDIGYTLEGIENIANLKKLNEKGGLIENE